MKSTRSSKAIFFVRHNNDIDHIVPVVYKVLSTESAAVDLIILTDESKRNDYRIRYLRQFDALTVYHVNEIFPRNGPAILNPLKPGVKSKLWGAIDRFSGVLSDRAPLPDLTRTAEESLEHLAGGFDDVVVAFDWPPSEGSPLFGVVEGFVTAANAAGYTTISLPHGDSPYYNALISERRFESILEEGGFSRTTNDLTRLTFSTYDRMRIFDHVVMPNELTAERVRDVLDPDRVNVLGSPRFNREWLATLDSIRPEFDRSREAGINAVFFLRLAKYFVHVDEVVRTIQMLTRLPGLHLVVKEHPRGRILDPSSVDDVPNLTIVGQHVDSSSLIGWGDVFLDIGTSIVFEAVMREKPVLSLEYLHANRTTVSEYFESSEIRTKDELYYSLSSMYDTGVEGFYSKNELGIFTDEMIEPTERPPLQRYVELLFDH